MKLLASIILSLSLFLPSTLQAKELQLEEVMNATCRIISNSYSITRGRAVNYGTGTVVYEDEQKYYVLTNAHVVGNADTVKVEFFRNGYKSEAIQSDVVSAQYNPSSSIDVSILSVNKIALGGYTPIVISPVSSSFVPNERMKIYGAGSPAGRWNQAWVARVINLKNNYFVINMDPADGQSGTGILTTVEVNGEKETRLCGLLSWRLRANNIDAGGAITSKRIYDILYGRAERDRVSFNTISDVHCATCGKKKSEHGYLKTSKDGEFIKKDGKPFLTCPDKFEKYETQGYYICPHGHIHPMPEPYRPYRQSQPQPQQPRNSDLPPIFGDKQQNKIPSIFPDDVQPNKPDTPQPKDVPNPLVEENKELLKKLEALENQNNVLGNNYRVLERTNQDILNDYTKVKDDKKDLENDVNSLTTEVTQEREQKKALLERVSDLVEKNKESLNKINIPFFEELGLGSVLGLILSFLLGSITLSGGMTYIWHRSVYPMLVKRFGWFPAKILSAIGRRKLEKIIKKKVDKNPPIVYNNDDPLYVDDESDETEFDNRLQEVSTIIVNNDIDIDTLQLKAHYRDIFKSNNNRYDGIGMKEWAARLHFYKEAVEKLRRGELMDVNGSPIQNGVKIADAIDRYVRDRMIDEFRYDTLSGMEADALYRRAYFAVLYRDAVNKLRQNALDVLNYEDAALAIEDEVKRKILNLLIEE